MIKKFPKGKTEKKTNKVNNKPVPLNIPLVALVPSVVVITFAVMTVFLLTVGMLSSVEVEAEGSCNTGMVGIDIQSKNMIQPKECLVERYITDDEGNHEIIYQQDPKNLNMTCYKEDLLLDHVDLRGLQNLSCSGKVKSKMPFIIMTLFMNVG